MLRPDALVARLVERGLVDAERIVDGDLVVRDASRRNRNHRVESARGPSLFVKLARGPEHAALLDQEAAALALLATDPSLAAGVPALRHHARDEGMLVTELIRGAETLHEHHRRVGRFPPEVGAEVGRFLARLHASPLARTHPRALPPSIPPVFGMASPPLDHAREATGGARAVLRILHESPALVAGLDDLRASWAQSCLVHGDVKGDNCLVDAARDPPRVALADWESAGMGDPCWDVGCAFVDHLASWIGSIPLAGDEPPEEAAARAAFPLAAMGPSLRAFWHAYAATLGLPRAEAARRLDRSVRYAGARLVQTAFEHVQSSHALTGTAVLALQLADNVLQRPADAATHLLSLGDAA